MTGEPLSHHDQLLQPPFTERQVAFPNGLPGVEVVSDDSQKAVITAETLAKQDQELVELGQKINMVLADPDSPLPADVRREASILCQETTLRQVLGEVDAAVNAEVAQRHEDINAWGIKALRDVMPATKAPHLAPKSIAGATATEVPKEGADILDPEAKLHYTEDDVKELTGRTAEELTKEVTQELGPIAQDLFDTVGAHFRELSGHFPKTALLSKGAIKAALTQELEKVLHIAHDVTGSPTGKHAVKAELTLEAERELRSTLRGLPIDEKHIIAAVDQAAESQGLSRSQLNEFSTELLNKYQQEVCARRGEFAVVVSATLTKELVLAHAPTVSKLEDDKPTEELHLEADSEPTKPTALEGSLTEGVNLLSPGDLSNLQSRVIDFVNRAAASGFDADEIRAGVAKLYSQLQHEDVAAVDAAVGKLIRMVEKHPERWLRSDRPPRGVKRPARHGGVPPRQRTSPDANTGANA